MKKPLRTASMMLAAIAAASPAGGQSATDIHLLRLDRAGGVTVVVGDPVAVTDRDGYDNQPAFTAEGNLLFTSIREDQADTYRYETSTGRVSRVTRTPEAEYSPTPLADGTGFSVVRVEADSAQRLWSFRMDGSDPRLLLPDVQPVGYHAWASSGRVAVFVLGEPTTLRIADLGTGETRIVASRIGRSLQRRPGSGTITFTQETPDGWRIRELDPATGAVSDLAPLPDPEGYHAWTPGGELLTAAGTRLLRWDHADARWIVLADLRGRGLGRISRLAVSPAGDRLAIVVDRPDADPEGSG